MLAITSRPLGIIPLIADLLRDPESGMNRWPMNRNCLPLTTGRYLGPGQLRDLADELLAALPLSPKAAAPGLAP